MQRVLLSLLLLSFALHALELDINSDKFKRVSQKFLTQENIDKLIAEKRVAYSQFVNNSTSNFDNSSNRSATHKEYARLKMLLVSIPKETRKSEIKDALRTAFFKQYSPKKEEFSFVYKISYPNDKGLRGDDIFEALQKKISLYILNKYGISNIEDNAILTDKGMSSTTKNYTLGTTESNFLNNFDNPYFYEQDKTIRSGVVSFVFYPFVMLKQNHNRTQGDLITANEDITTEFTEINDEDGFSNIKFSLNPQDKEKIEEFVSNYTKTYSVDISKSVNQISNKILKYNRIAQSLFDAYPECQTIECLDKSISKKLNSFSTIKKSKEYTYNIDLSNDDDFEYVILPAFRKLEKYLRRDTQMSSLEDRETIQGDNYSKDTMESKFVAVVKNVSVTPYIKESNRLGLHFTVKVSFEASDLCSQYFAGISKDKLYGMRFVKLKSDDKIIEVAQTELTNKIFSKIYPRASRDKECKKTRGSKEPVNCLSYSLLDKFLEKLNRKSRKYKYRFFTCKEALFFSTCGGKQKYCWGNSTEYKKYEYLRNGKYDTSIYNVAQKQKNKLNLYDLCGNTTEYCTDKNGWYRTFGSSAKKLEPRIYRNSYSDINSIRLVREKI